MNRELGLKVKGGLEKYSPLFYIVDFAILLLLHS